METLMGSYRKYIILAVAIFLQVLGLAIQIRRPIAGEDNSSGSRLIRLWAVSVVAPMEKGIVRVQTSAAGVWHNYFYLRGVRQENRDLKDQIEKLRLEQVQLKQDADQAHRLQALLGFKEQYICGTCTTAAQVIGSSGSEQSRLVYIDKGSDEGLKPEMPVITPEGVVGKVLNVIDGSTSQVLLINDQQSGVGTIIEQSRLQGVLKGRASGELVIDKIMADEDVKPGDRILTSGGDRIFPKGLPIGTVAKIAKGAEFLQLTVKPAAMLNHLEEVLVITKKEQHETPASAPAPTRAAEILAQRLPQVPDKPAPPGTMGSAAPKPALAATTTNVVVKPGASSGTAASAANGATATPNTDTLQVNGATAIMKKAPVTAEPNVVGATAPASQAKSIAKPQVPVATKPAATKPAATDPNPAQDTPQ
jgi:rod shape-determining protein MreC